MQAVWPDSVVEDSNLAFNVFAIRKALGESSDADRYIQTVPKRGYRFIAPVVTTPGDAPADLLRSASGFNLPEAAAQLDAREVSPKVDGLRFQDPVVGRLAESGMFSISPDGRHLVFGAEGSDGSLRPDGIGSSWPHRKDESLCFR